MTEALAGWLPAQRWFRAKQRPIASVSRVDSAALAVGEIAVLEVRYADDGPPEQYLVPLVEGRDPRNGEGAWSALVTAMAGEAVIAAERGRFVGSRTDALRELLPANLAERRLTVEQSNTSVVIGERLILKLYRLLEPGTNPDLEVSAFLTDAAFGDTPALAGSITYEPGDGSPMAAAMLQAYVPSHGDAWAAMLRVLSDDPSTGVRMAAQIGALTARLHAVLGSAGDDPAFPVRAATPAETSEWRASAERQLAEAIGALRGADHARLVAMAPAIRARFADTFGAAPGAARVTRIHGDYHLGQLLARNDGGFSIIDFEGEPARSPDDRRRPSSPLRDAAGLLRSLDYAARATGAAHAGFDADAWVDEATAAFLGSYGDVDRALLAAFELEKACYEVRYEAANRPAWLWLPLTAVDRLSRG